MIKYEFEAGQERVWSHGGWVSLKLAKERLSLHPDEARLLALRLIREADEADKQEW